MPAGSGVQLLPLAGLPMVGPGTDLAAEILAAMGRAGLAFRDGDILVVAQKIISKAEGCRKLLQDIVPSEEAEKLAEKVRKDPRLVEAILSESRCVLRAAADILIVEHRLGHIMANAGIDQSNVEADPQKGEAILLLPQDPDASATSLRASLASGSDTRIGVVVSDSFGRAWRKGTIGVALGSAGIPVIIDRRGERDLFGRTLRVTEIAFADAVASAAVLVMGEGAEGCPAVLVRGLEWPDSRQQATDVLRPSATDLFR